MIGPFVLRLTSVVQRSKVWQSATVNVASTSLTAMPLRKAVQVPRRGIKLRSRIQASNTGLKP